MRTRKNKSWLALNQMLKKGRETIKILNQLEKMVNLTELKARLEPISISLSPLEMSWPGPRESHKQK